jgi:hypothetical protein
MKRAAITMVLALGCGGVGNASAVMVSSMTIQEVGGIWGGGSSVNGGTNPLNAGIFFFVGITPPPDGQGNAGSVSFDSFSTVGGITPSSPVGITNGTQQNSNAFSAGFVFAGLQFRPNSCGANAINGVCTGATTGLAASHTGAANGLSIDLSGWGGDYGSLAQILQSPNTGALVVATSAVGAAGPNRFYYSLDWRHTHPPVPPAGPFTGNISDWHLEGIGTVVPLPPAAWLFSSGLLGLFGISRRKKSA